MAVSFTNNWKNILDKLENTLRTEFKGALPVYTGNKAPAGSTYLQLNPVGSELLEYAVTSELREFTIQIFYYFLEACFIPLFNTLYSTAHANKPNPRISLLLRR